MVQPVAIEQEQSPRATIDTRQRVFLMGFRQVLIMALGYVEDYIEVERSIIPRRKREGSCYER